MMIPRWLYPLSAINFMVSASRNLTEWSNDPTATYLPLGDQESEVTNPPKVCIFLIDRSAGFNFFYKTLVKMLSKFALYFNA